MDQVLENKFIGIMSEELIPAMGCTEPIALAYAASRAMCELNGEPQRIVARCSGNMIKNVRCVSIPNSNGMIGIEAAVVLGAFGGDYTRGMEVLDSVVPRAISKTEAFLKDEKCKVEYLDSDIPLHFIIEITDGVDTVEVEVRNSHMNIVRITKNGQCLCKNDCDDYAKTENDRALLSIETIKQFADEVDISKIKKLIDKQIRYNMDIAYEGISADYGLNIGKMISACYPDGVVTRL